MQLREIANVRSSEKAVLFVKFASSYIFLNLKIPESENVAKRRKCIVEICVIFASHKQIIYVQENSCNRGRAAQPRGG